MLAKHTATTTSRGSSNSAHTLPLAVALYSVWVWRFCGYGYHRGVMIEFGQMKEVPLCWGTLENNGPH